MLNKAKNGILCDFCSNNVSGNEFKYITLLFKEVSVCKGRPNLVDDIIDADICNDCLSKIKDNMKIVNNKNNEIINGQRKSV